jgi:hypothetical protein
MADTGSNGPNPWIAIVLAPLLTLATGSVGFLMASAKTDALVASHTSSIAADEARLERLESRVGGHDAILAQIAARLDAVSATLAENDKHGDERHAMLLDNLRRMQDQLLAQMMHEHGHKD